MKKLDKLQLAQNISESVTNGIDSQRLCGACVTVRQEGEDIYSECFGVTAPGGCIPVKENTLFRLASMTKPITAVAVMQLVERGLLTLDTPIKRYLPEFDNMNVGAVIDGKVETVAESRTDITVKHLLTHTSGIGSGTVGARLASEMSQSDKASVLETVRYFSDKPLSFEPFTKEEYSGFAAFDVIVAIIEKITGEDYNEFLKKNIFDICGMTDTTFVPTEEQWGRLATLHNYTEQTGGFAAPVSKGCMFYSFPCEHYLGGAGLASTLQDYSRFAEMLLNNGVADGGRIVSAESVRAIQTPYFKKANGSEAWGLGVRVRIADGSLPRGVYGWSGAFGGHFWIDPENRITAVYLKNSLYDGGSGASTARQLEKDVYNSLK